MLLLARSRRRAFSLVELLVVIAIIAVLIGLLLPAVQATREAANRSHCGNNLHQLAVAAHNYHQTHGTLPKYFENPGATSAPVAGSWLALMLPFIEQDAVYRKMYDDFAATGFQTNQTTQVSAGTPPSGTQTTTTVTVPPTPGAPYNGYLYGGTPGYSYTVTTWSNPGTPAVYLTVNHGIWLDGVHDAIYKILICPSDPSERIPGLVYGGYWGATSYAANWNAWGNGIGGLPTAYNTPPQRLSNMSDGTSNTVLFGEHYQICDRLERIALYSWYYHCFGLNWYGEGNTLMFQVRPKALNYYDCPPPERNILCCDNWRAQTGHTSMMVAMADASVRPVSGSISQSTWDHAMLPRDGETLGSDW